MRILWLNVGLLLPLDKGGRLRTWHLMRHLARRHEITYLAFRDADQPEADLVGMREVCSRLETMPRRESPKRSLKFYVEAAGYIAHPRPYAVAKYRSIEYARRLRTLLDTVRFDLIVCDFLPPLVNLPARLPCPAVLFTHNVEAEIWRSARRDRDRPGGAGALPGSVAPNAAVRKGRARPVQPRPRRFRGRLEQTRVERRHAPSVPIAVVPTGVTRALLPDGGSLERPGRRPGNSDPPMRRSGPSSSRVVAAAADACRTVACRHVRRQRDGPRG